MASVTVAHVPGTAFQTRIDNGDLAIIGDEPIDSGGDGLGLSPYELILAALGHCTVLTVLLYARRKGWPVEGVSVRAHFERLVVDDGHAEGHARRKVERITEEVTLDGNLDDAQRARLMEIAGKCPVHRTLTGELEIVDVMASVAPVES